MLHGHSHNTAVAAAEEEVKSLYRAKGFPARLIMRAVCTLDIHLLRWMKSYAIGKMIVKPSIPSL